MISTRFSIVVVLALTGLGLFTGSATAQTNYTWNNTSTNVGVASSWASSGSPGFPGSTGQLDNALFNVLGTMGTSAQFNPDLTGLTAVINQTTLNSTANFTGWNFTGAGGNIAQASLTVSGPVTHTINGPSILGIPAGSLGATTPSDVPLVVTITGGSTLAFQGASTFIGTSPTTQANNAGNINIKNGTLVLDNTGTNTNNRLPTTNTIVMNGGTFSALGNSAGSTFNVGTLNVTASSGGPPGEGSVTISVSQPNGATGSTVLNFANTGSYTLRTTTGLGYNFVGVGGVLGSAGGPQITFASAPTISTTTGTGMIVGSTTATSSTVGFAIATDSSGTGWATYVTPSGGTGGIEVLAPSTTATTAANLQALTAASVADFTPAAGSTTTLTGTSTTGSIRIVPAGAGATLALGANSLKTNAIMLTGSNDFSITGTGALDGTATKLIWVTNPNTTLNIQAPLDGSGSAANPIDIAGPGFVALTGTTSQITITGSNRVNLLNGTLRGNATQLGGIGTTGGDGVIAFRGGVLEITGGGTFSRPINFTNTAGAVNWNSSTNGDTVGGSGGFSAFGANASVNIGGASALLIWGVASSGFVQDGYALKFGSTQSNAVLAWQNPLALDSGSPGNYLVREINITAGTGGDKTQMTGVISGSASTDLLKTGTGTLELLGINTYQGNTLIQGGTLIVGSGGTLGTSDHNTGNIVVGNGATLSAVDGSGGMSTTITGNGTAMVIVNPGGAIRGGNPTVAADALGTLYTNSNIVINSSASTNGILRVEAARTGANTASSSLIKTTGIFNLNPGSGNKFTIDLVNNAANPLFQGESYSVTLATAASFQLNGLTLGAGASIASSNFTLQSAAFGTAFSNVSLAVDGTGQNLVLAFTPVPEPAAVLAIAAGVLGLGGLVRRRMRRVVPTIAA